MTLRRDNSSSGCPRRALCCNRRGRSKTSETERGLRRRTFRYLSQPCSSAPVRCNLCFAASVSLSRPGEIPTLPVCRNCNAPRGPAAPFMATRETAPAVPRATRCPLLFRATPAGAPPLEGIGWKIRSIQRVRDGSPSCNWSIAETVRSKTSERAPIASRRPPEVARSPAIRRRPARMPVHTKTGSTWHSRP